jgi:dUTP pyrophosphatase
MAPSIKEQLILSVQDPTLLNTPITLFNLIGIIADHPALITEQKTRLVESIKVYMANTIGAVVLPTQQPPIQDTYVDNTDVIPVEFLFTSNVNKAMKYATDGSAAMDIHADIINTEFDDDVAALKTDDMLRLFPGGTILIETGFKVAIPKGYEIQIFPRSGLSTRGITVANSPGLIDSDYRGSVKVIIRNDGTNYCDFNHGDRIAQMKIVKSLKIQQLDVKKLPSTTRGEGGFGHTGR